MFVLTSVVIRVPQGLPQLFIPQQRLSSILLTTQRRSSCNETKCDLIYRNDAIVVVLKRKSTTINYLV